MSEDNTSRRSGGVEAEETPDEAIDTSDIPPLTQAFFERAELRMPEEPVVVALDLDPDVLRWFRDQGEGWQERVNAALRLYVEAHEAARRAS